MTSAGYVQAVLDHVPTNLPLRQQIAVELEGHIAERIEHGHTLEEVIAQLGDPLVLAESYLAAVPLVAPRLLSRLAAKAIDVAVVVGIAFVLAVVSWLALPDVYREFAMLGCVIAASFGFAAYTVFAEYHTGRTIGKRLCGLVVVRESGARIGLGQSLLRQLPFFAQFSVIDSAFALFTDRQQRAFELLTKTRVVAAAA